MKIRLPENNNRASRPLSYQRFAGAIALLATFSVVIGGCGGGDDSEPRNTSARSTSLSSLFKATVSVGPSTGPASAKYDCWVAAQPRQRDEGFAFISASEIPPGRGMIVVYPNNRTAAFAGQNTLVDLEVVFAEGIAEGVGRITNIGSIAAFQRTPVSSVKPVKYVLFVPAGDLARSKPAVGTLLAVPVVTPTR